MSASEKAESLRFSIFQSKSRDKDILNFILGTERKEREQIREAYNRRYPSPGLVEDLRKKLSGDFRNCCVELFQTRAEYDADTLVNCFKGFSIDEDPIYEIIMNRPYELIQEIKALYEKKSKNSLDATVKKHFPNPLKKNLSLLLNSKRSTNQSPDHDDCQAAANKLAITKPDDWLNDQEIMDMFAKRSAEELVLISRYYLRKKGQNIMTTCDTLSKSQKKYILAILFNVVAPPEMFANKINEAIKGLGTDTKLLERVIVTRYDVDMALIKKYYRQNFNVSAKEDVVDDTSGVYRDLLCGLMNKYDSNDY